MSKYMLLLRGDDTPEHSPTEMQDIVAEYMAWARNLRAEGKMVGGEELQTAFKLIAGTGTDLQVTDGPFAETREAIGGYFLIEATDESEALEIAKRCPGLKRGGKVEMHQVIDH